MKRIAIVATIVTAIAYASHAAAKVYCCHTDWFNWLFGL